MKVVVTKFQIVLPHTTYEWCVKDADESYVMRWTDHGPSHTNHLFFHVKDGKIYRNYYSGSYQNFAEDDRFLAKIVAMFKLSPTATEMAFEKNGWLET